METVSCDAKIGLAVKMMAEICGEADSIFSSADADVDLDDEMVEIVPETLAVHTLYLDLTAENLTESIQQALIEAFAHTSQTESTLSQLSREELADLTTQIQSLLENASPDDLEALSEMYSSLDLATETENILLGDAAFNSATSSVPDEAQDTLEDIPLSNEQKDEEDEDDGSIIFIEQPEEGG